MIMPALPCLLAFAAGAMNYVVVEELIPETQEGKHSNMGPIGFALGFLLMMSFSVNAGAVGWTLSNTVAYLSGYSAGLETGKLHAGG